MAPRKEKENYIAWRIVSVAAAIFSIALLTLCLNAQNRNAPSTSNPPASQVAALTSNETSDSQSATNTALAIPLGTVLPLRLNTSLSSSKSKAGQIISGRVMQTIALPGGARVPHGSKVLGHIVEVRAATASSPALISLQFDQLLVAGQTIPVTTNLRAIAGFVAVNDAQTPTIPAGQGDNYNQLTTVQVGGDVVFGWGGPVTRGDDTSQVVGKAVTDGVVSLVSAKEGTKCRGALYGNENPQALWVFSSDACGVYGIAHVAISHAGRSNPVGLIVFTSDGKDLSIRSGAGMLLRVTQVGN
jgi:hypothetical protein